MLQGKKKNILVTTMSIFNTHHMRVNYYYSPEREKALLCDGISSLEAGSKYILSRHPIDEILVMGTKETICKEDIPETEDLVDELQKLNNDWKNKSGEEFSAYRFYKYRIASFLYKRGAGDCADIQDVAEETVGKGIEKQRKKDIEEILSTVMDQYVSAQESGVDRQLLVSELLLDEKNEFWRNLQKEIQHSIERAFESSEPYLNYIAEKGRLEKYQSGFAANEDIVSRCKETRAKIAEDSTLTFFEKEFLYISLNSKVNESIYRNELLNKEAEIAELRKESARLSYEIESLRNQRRISEYTYAKYKVYQMVDDTYKLFPLEENRKNIQIRFIPEQLEDQKIDNISGIVKALQGTSGDEINLYIDMQGGNRTSSYVRNAALSILNNQNPDQFRIKEIVATNYNSMNPGASEIVNETDRYRILDLASGMNAFIQYGKADMIQKYCEDMNIAPESSVGKLVDFMVKIDESISLCDINALTEAIEGLGKFFLAKEDEGNSYVGNIFHTLQDGIRNDYGELLEKAGSDGKVDYLELIAWCAGKGFIQQALTLIEDKMPERYMKEVLLYECYDERWETFIDNLGPKYEKRIENKLFYNLEGKCKDKMLYEVLWYIKNEGRITIMGKMNFMDEFKRSRSPKRLVDEELGRINTRNRNNRRKQIEEKEIQKDDLIAIRKELNEKELCEKEFINQYCKFRRWEPSFEEGGKLDLMCAANLYECWESEWQSGYDYGLKFSLIGCCGERDYFYDISERERQPQQTRQQTPTQIRITLKVEDKFEDRMQELDELFLLHDALKKERNCINHASTKGVRLSNKIVKRAIEIYVKRAKEILTEVS